MSTILSKIIVLSFVAVVVASTMYVFLTDNRPIYLGVEYPEYEIQNFKSYDDLNTYLHTNYESYSNNYFDLVGISPEPRAGANCESGLKFEESVDMANDYSDTNIQEIGVDEPDFIKTDGTYLYVISNFTLYIIYAYPAEDAEIISTICHSYSIWENCNRFIC